MIEPKEQHLTQECMAFLREVGFEVQEQSGAGGVVPGVKIQEGALLVDPETALVSDVLHEAGHLATVPGRFRKWFTGNVQGGQKRIMEVLEHENVDPDSPMFRAIIQCSDTEATAWAWAAGRHLGFPEEKIIRDKDYGEDGESIRLMLSLNSYVGIHGLANAGFCCTRPILSDVTGLPAYPELKMWVQPEDLSRTPV